MSGFNSKIADAKRANDKIMALFRSAESQHLETSHPSLECWQRYNKFLAGSLDILRRNGSLRVPIDTLSTVLVEDFLKDGDDK